MRGFAVCTPDFQLDRRLVGLQSHQPAIFVLLVASENLECFQGFGAEFLERVMFYGSEGQFVINVEILLLIEYQY